MKTICLPVHLWYLTILWVTLFQRVGRAQILRISRTVRIGSNDIQSKNISNLIAKNTAVPQRLQVYTETIEEIFCVEKYEVSITLPYSGYFYVQLGILAGNYYETSVAFLNELF